MRIEIRLSGSGGQGLITAGVILAKAAALYDGKNAVQSQSYGPEARGGASKAEVIISTAEINYPKVQSPDVLVALTQEAVRKYTHDLRSGAVVIIDSLLVKEPPKGDFTVYSVPVILSASDVLGFPVAANVITLGVMNRLCRLVSDRALEEAVKQTFSAKAAEMNRKALALGARLAEDASSTRR